MLRHYSSYFCCFQISGTVHTLYIKVWSFFCQLKLNSEMFVAWGIMEREHLKNHRVQ